MPVLRPIAAALCVLGIVLPLLGAAQTTPERGLDLLHLDPTASYADWRVAAGWEDRRPFSNSAKRFRIENGTLRLETAGDSYVIGRMVPIAERVNVEAYAYLRFVLRVEDTPRGAAPGDEDRDDSAFHIYAVFRETPLQALEYFWSWALPVGATGERGRWLWWDFHDVHYKVFGFAQPSPQWLTVEVNLREDFRKFFPGQPLPMLGALALKADSNDIAGAHSLAWLRSVTLHRTSLRDEGMREGDRLDDTIVWFR